MEVSPITEIISVSDVIAAVSLCWNPASQMVVSIGFSKHFSCIRVLNMSHDRSMSDSWDRSPLNIDERRLLAATC